MRPKYHMVVLIAGLRLASARALITSGAIVQSCNFFRGGLVVTQYGFSTGSLHEGQSRTPHALVPQPVNPPETELVSITIPHGNSSLTYKS